MQRIAHGKVKFYSHPEYGTRLLFTNGLINPRDQLGKIGIQYHTWFGSFFYATVPVFAATIDENGITRTQPLYLSRKSLIEYLRPICGKDISRKTTNSELIALLNQVLRNPNENSRGQNLRHAGRHHNRLLNNFFLAIFDFFYRLFFSKTERAQFERSEELASRQFKEGKKHHAPETNKDIDKTLDELERTYCLEQQLIEDAVAAFMKKHKRLSAAVKQQGVINVVSHLLNLWLDQGDSFDVSTAYDKTITSLIFIRYKSDLINIIRKLNSKRSQTVISGNPQFLKAIVDQAAERGVNFKKYHARGVVIDHTISESLRDQLVECGFTGIHSTYSAPNLDRNMGVEAEFEIHFRKILEKNPAMQKELFGPRHGLPMIFHFNPVDYHIESTDQDDLLLTCNRSDRSSSCIRYESDDKGRVFAASDIEALLAKYGYDNVKPRNNLPLVLVWKQDATAAPAVVGYGSHSPRLLRARANQEQPAPIDAAELAERASHKRRVSV